MGKWEQRGNPCSGKDAATTFQSQGTFILQAKNKPGTWIFMADRWNKTDLPDSRYVWLPLYLKDGNVEIKWTDAK
jgi:hypothetical protein